MNDTICAISTPAGIAGIAVIRISGPLSIDICNKIWRGKPLAEVKSHTVHLGEIVDCEGAVLDQCVATVFRSPGSFTGEDTVEISVHGSQYVQRAALQSLTAVGARLAEPGEFTRRAFISGHLDLAQAEAVADIIASESKAAHRLAISQMKGAFSRRLETLRSQLVDISALLELELDFSEEDVTFADRTRLLNLANQIHTELSALASSFSLGQAIKNGIPTAIVGDTNAGKSSLLNLLVGDDRAIVSEIHGTTRDTIEETVTIDDYTFRFIDTAGVRHTSDPIERIGIERSLNALNRAQIIILVADITAPLNHILLSTALQAVSADPASSLIILANKTDLADPTPFLAILSSHLPSPLPQNIAVLPYSTSRTASPTFACAENDSAKTESAGITSSEKDSSIINSPGAASSPASPLDNESADTISVEKNSVEIKSPRIYAREKSSSGNTDRLRQELIKAVSRNHTPDTLLITNLRHAEALRAAAQSTRRVIDGLQSGLPSDLVSQDLRQTLHHLGTITSAIPSSEILSTIFSRFCIGK